LKILLNFNGIEHFRIDKENAKAMIMLSTIAFEGAIATAFIISLIVNAVFIFAILTGNLTFEIAGTSKEQLIAEMWDRIQRLESR